MRLFRGREHPSFKHGYHGSRVYRLWASIKKRCNNKSAANYKYYGGRGIRMCKAWQDNPKAFCDWALKNGYKQGLEIDRKNVDGNYCPSNCQFITHKENSQPHKRRLSCLNKTGISGVVKTKFNTYEVYGRSKGKQKYFGVFKTIEEARKKKERLTDNPKGVE